MMRRLNLIRTLYERQCEKFRALLARMVVATHISCCWSLRFPNAIAIASRTLDGNTIFLRNHLCNFLFTDFLWAAKGKLPSWFSQVVTD